MMIDPTLSVAQIMVAAPGTQAVLLGSGVSRSAGIPTGWDITLDLIRRIAKASNLDCGADPAAWYRENFGGGPDYSELLTQLAGTPAERRAILQPYFVPTESERAEGKKLPAPAHKAIARLVVLECVRLILTTNFDRLMETALREEGIEPVVLSTPDAIKGAAPLLHQRCVVLKLHGDYLDDRIRNTMGELDTYDPQTEQYLDRVLDEFGLIVCGWSAEWDGALRGAMERCETRRYTTTWVSVGPLGDRAGRLVKHREAQVVVSDGADSFFPALLEKVISLRELGSDSPLTVAAAVASVKRYVADEGSRVRLHDLVFAEARRAAERLRAEEFSFQCSNLRDVVAARILKMEALTECVREMFLHGCRWVNGEREEVFVNALGCLSYPGQAAGSRELVLLARYPMMSVLYAGAMGALAARNWGLLRRLLMFRYDVDGVERTACLELAVARVIGWVAPAWFPKSLSDDSPPLASQYIAGLLVPPAEQIHPNSRALFDELEVWVALACFDAANEDNLIDFSPVGRFAYPPGSFRVFGDHMLMFGPATPPPQIKKLWADAIEAGAHWPPLAAGWFDGSVERRATVRLWFDNWLLSLVRQPR